MFEILIFRDYFNIIASTNRDEITSLASRLLAILCNCADHSQLRQVLFYSVSVIACVLYEMRLRFYSFDVFCAAKRLVSY